MTMNREDATRKVRGLVDAAQAVALLGAQGVTPNKTKQECEERSAEIVEALTVDAPETIWAEIHIKPTYRSKRDDEKTDMVLGTIQPVTVNGVPMFRVQRYGAHRVVVATRMVMPAAIHSWQEDTEERVIRHASGPI